MADPRAPVRAFVTGCPIRHSRSPLIHRSWLSEFAIDGTYEAVEVPPDSLSDFVDALRRPDSRYVGGNVTLPHKETVLALADRPDPLAEEIGAANTLWVEDGRIHATNTDAYGFCANLDAGVPEWSEAAKDKTAVVLGAGGASRAVLQALRDREFGTIHLVNRTIEKAVRLADRFGDRIRPHPFTALTEVLSGASLFVNTSSLGMDGTPAPHIDFTNMCPGALVTDIVYVPLTTPFIRMAQGQGLATVDGLGMLLHQAVPGFEKWFGHRPEVTLNLRSAIVSDLELKQ